MCLTDVRLFVTTYTAVSTKVVQKKSVKAYATIQKASLRKCLINFDKSSESILPAISSLYGRGIMDTELLSKFIGYFQDYLSAFVACAFTLFWRTFVETAVYVPLTSGCMVQEIRVS